MFDTLLATAALSPFQLSIALVAAFGAGLVRGFSGFALSALLMASIALMIPPVELIAVCWMLELSASLLMVRGGIANADRTIVTGLVAGSLVGAPIGLALTNAVPLDVSKAIALSLIIGLALLQLLKVRATFLATRPGLLASGAMAGIATGLASVGGMVVALYVLAREQAAVSMRASLVMFLFVNSFFGFVFLLLFRMMDQTALARGALLVIPCMIGVFLGKKLFTPRLEPYYKPFCLLLLIGLAAAGMVRLALGL